MKRNNRIGAEKGERAVNGDCKGCSASVRIDDESIRRMVEKVSRIGELCVADEVYEERLSRCYACPSLQYGTTCAHCGCIVQVRAKLKDKTCPAPGQANGFWIA
ncbi:DUF6171 family protein [Cohnella fermenti]|uniref:Uncharacterized protein n=1 Tax=Cohnella fermenti TaxID=2565925 RepID=A0A4S4C2F4_9BACL|nr:DUF6171 family protein [Cohnella fermenti]THF81699.1 hypothetical protein E6C55_08205 [Cohnella fermenti]